MLYYSRMKNIIMLIVITLFALCSSVNAEERFGRHDLHGHYEYRGHGYGNNGWVWVVPTIIGGVIGYEIAKSQPTTQTVIIQQQNPTVCSPWITTVNPDGSTVQSRTCR